jgi:hypothetical protein
MVTSLNLQDDRAFARQYAQYQDKFGTPDECLINILHKAYLPDEQNPCLQSTINHILPSLKDNGFVFDDSALGLPIEFIALAHKLYEYIGWDHQSYVTGNTLLHHQVMSGSIEGITYLIQKGVDQSATNHEGFTPLTLLQHINQHDTCTHYIKMLGQLR